MNDIERQSVIAAVFFLLIYPAPVLGQELPILPDPALTPGVVATIDQALVCATGDESYSRQHRQTSSALKATVRAEYHAQHCGEIDHRLPLSLGGADALGNLWCQPDGSWGWKTKDRLEDATWQAVCHKRTMSLSDAQAIFMAPDWRVGYCALPSAERLKDGPPCPPQ